MSVFAFCSCEPLPRYVITSLQTRKTSLNSEGTNRRVSIASYKGQVQNPITTLGAHNNSAQIGAQKSANPQSE